MKRTGIRSNCELFSATRTLDADSLSHICSRAFYFPLVYHLFFREKKNTERRTALHPMDRLEIWDPPIIDRTKRRDETS